MGYAIAHELAARPKPARFARDPDYPRELYYEAQRRDIFPGGAYPGAEPFGEGTSLLAGVQAAKDRGLYGAYHWCFSVDDVETALLTTGPVLVATRWHADRPRQRRGRMRLTNDGGETGRHAYLLLGVDFEDKRSPDPSGVSFLVLNSWGPEWGSNGRAWLTREALGERLADFGEAVVPIDRHNPRRAAAFVDPRHPGVAHG